MWKTLLEHVFGIDLNHRKEGRIETPILPTEPDGSYIFPANSEKQTLYFDNTLTTDGLTESELINTYRELSKDPEVSKAITEIVSEAVSADDGYIVNLDFDNIEGFAEKTKKRIIDEFDSIQKMMGFKDFPEDHFRRFYIDGRVYYQILVGQKKTEGIKKILMLDPRTIRPVTERDLIKSKDETFDISKDKKYYVYVENNITINSNQWFSSSMTRSTGSGEIMLSEDSIAYANSGEYGDGTIPLSLLHYAIKPANQLRMIEDALVIYRWSRAAEKRVFKVPVSNVPKHMQEQYLRDFMNRFKNSAQYDSTTGKIKDSRRQITMLEDFYFPTVDGEGVNIDVLPGGQMLSGDLPDLNYFRKKLLSSLKVPLSRFNEDGSSASVLGRSSEITRDELNFQKFISGQQKRYSFIFLKMLEVQLRLKNIVSEDEWNVLREKLSFVWAKDNVYTEMKNSELTQSRMQTLGTVEPYISKYFSNRYVMKEILMMTDDEIINMTDEINKERQEMGDKVRNADVSRTVQTNPTIVAPGTEPLIFNNVIGADDSNAEEDEDGREDEE
jgi:hypothetical protein